VARRTINRGNADIPLTLTVKIKGECTMRFFYDMAGAEPIIKDLIFNEELASNGDTKVYDGALVKLVDYDDVDHGKFICLADNATVNENVVGIICEEVAASGDTYLPDAAAATGTWARKKVLVNPNAVYLAEYVRKDRAGTENRDTGYVFAAAGTASTTSPNTGAADELNGGWIYFDTGANAGYLHYILDSANATTNGVATLRTAVVNAVASGDYELVVMPALGYKFDLNATCTDLKSEVITGSLLDYHKGIDFWIKAPGVPFQKLDATKHDALKIDNARLYHELKIGAPYFGGTHTLS
jgi:hypothetical protein